MSDTYGSNLNSFGAPDSTGGPAFPQQDNPAPQPGTTPNDGQAGADLSAPPVPAADASQSPSFGASFRNMLPGAHYTQPDPQLSPLDQSANFLTQRVQRANAIATNPIAAILAPRRVQAARDFAAKGVEQLQKIEQQRSGIQAGRVQAETLGLAPGEASDQATQEDRVNIAMGKAMKGDMRAFQGLQAVAPDKAAAIAPQVHETVAGHLDKAQYAFDSLSGMPNQGQYAAKLDQLRKDGTLTELETLGLKVPPTYDAFNASKAAEGRALREARIGINNLRAELERRNTYQPMEKKEAETYAGRFKTVYGDEFNGGPWSVNAASGTRGQVINGVATVDQYGKTGAAASADQRKELGEEFRNAVPKEELEKFRAFNRTYTLAEPTEAQKKRGDVVNTNPNVQQGIAEGLASMLRGGAGGANVGLLKIELAKRGWAQGTIDALISNYNGALNTMFNADRGYVSQKTQQQIRDVLDVLKTYNTGTIDDRALQIARRAGALGLDVSALGLGKNETAGPIGEAVEEGRQAQIARMKPYFQPIGGGDGVLQIGAQRPGAGAAVVPPGTQNNTQLPNAQPLQTPVQQAQQPVQPSPQPPSVPPSQSQGANGGVQQPAPPAGPPKPPGGGAAPAPVTVAGQQVNVQLPPGASPQFMNSLQRVESGNEKSPWVAGNDRSSAKGAFQIIGATWKANKPAGAPDDPRQATPQQQAEAAANYAQKNARSLQANGVPVTDTTLYITHNLGAAGGLSLLKSGPGADARSIVGEEAARNNPRFFKGRPTVAVVLNRYQEAMSGAPGGDGGTVLAANNGLNFRERMRAGRKLAAEGGPDLSGERRTPGEIKEAWADLAPAIGSTGGAIVGGLSPIPGGTIVGGAGGGAAGQAFKDWLKGNAQNPKEILKQGALGAVLGIAPEGRPIIGAALRAGGAATVEGGAAAAEGGEAADVVDRAVKAGGYALGGEALGRFVSSVGRVAHQTVSKFTTPIQQDLSEQAGKLAAARKVLETEQPKLPGEGAGPNPKYDAAKKQADDATEAIKNHGQNPDDMVHAYEQATAGVSRGEAAAMRGAEKEQRNVSQGYNDLREDVRSTGVGTPKPNQPVPDGPLAQIRTAENPTGAVEEKFRADAEHAEMLIKAPAKDWGQKWDQLQNAGSELIRKRMAFLQNGDKPSADAMDKIFQGVRNQQKAAAAYVFGEKKGAQVIKRLEDLDTRYAKIMNATAGMKYEKMRTVLASGNTPERRELEKNFREFAKDDPSALRAFNAMKAGAKGDWKSEAALMGPVIAGEVAANLHGVPTVGAISALVGAHRLYRLMQGYVNARTLNQAVTFKDFLVNELRKGGIAPAVNSAVQRTAVQGGPELANNAAQ